jgi:hypothetical protein
MPKHKVKQLAQTTQNLYCLDVHIIGAFFIEFHPSRLSLEPLLLVLLELLNYDIHTSGCISTNAGYGFTAGGNNGNHHASAMGGTPFSENKTFCGGHRRYNWAWDMKCRYNFTHLLLMLLLLTLTGC